MEQSDKRQVPSLLKKTLAVDAYLTDALVKQVEKFLHLRQLKVHYRVLEISCHGIPWIVSIIALIWILDNPNLYQMQVNLLLGLILDIILVGILKAFTRRRRPAVNDDPFSMGPDKYAFPSGHASRATFVVYFLLNLWPVSWICIPPLFAWSTSVCVSRLLMRRHHILDICAGTFLGFLEGMIIGAIYLEPQTCANLVYWITDERLHGPEYDV